MSCLIERFSLDCRKTKTKLNTLANQRGHCLVVHADPCGQAIDTIHHWLGWAPSVHQPIVESFSPFSVPGQLGVFRMTACFIHTSVAFPSSMWQKKRFLRLCYNTLQKRLSTIIIVYLHEHQSWHFWIPSLRLHVVDWISYWLVDRKKGTNESRKFEYLIIKAIKNVCEVCFDNFSFVHLVCSQQVIT